MRTAYMITTHNPDEGLIFYIESLISACVSRIVIVNEASEAKYQPVFEMLAMYPGCTILSFEDARGEDAYVKALAWCDTHFAAFGYTDIVRVEYANETQRREILEKASNEAENPLPGTSEKRMRDGLIDTYDKVLDTIGQYREVLREWQPMRLRRTAIA